MKVSGLLENKEFDVNATVKIFTGGQWNGDGIQVGLFSCGTMKGLPRLLPGDVPDRFLPENIMDSNITYMTVDQDDGSIVVECDVMAHGRTQGPEIVGMLTVSTSHVSQETYRKLEQDGTRNEIGLPVYAKSAPEDGDCYGLYVYLENISWDTVPSDLGHLIKLAQQNGCGILCLDSEGPELENMPKFDW